MKNPILHPAFPYKRLYATLARGNPAHVVVLNEIAAYTESVKCDGKHTRGRKCTYCIPVAK